MRSPRSIAAAFVLLVLAAVAAGAAWLDRWEIAVTALSVLGLVTGVMALWAGVRAGQGERAVIRRLGAVEKAIAKQTAALDTHFGSLAAVESRSKTAEKNANDVGARLAADIERLEQAFGATDARSAEALEALRIAGIRRPGEVVLDTQEVVGILRSLQAQHLGRLDRAQDALDAAVARLEKR
ncbi:hypothetical protein [Kribbia dieselivorans]|uniref:hypothetical protein n=1 Tax=Kribbia dieselivorans TaxID=331526 RepID=UPI000838EC6A|nr:hypothetical protein [Kribbia dieselivorans]